MKKRILLGISLVLGLVLLPFISVLEARDFQSGRLLDLWVLEDKAFMISYTHSVMLSPVEEYYLIRDGRIVLDQSTFKDYGAGLPASTPYDFQFDQEDQVFRIYNIDREVNPLVYKVGTSRSDFKLVLKARLIDFKSFARERSSLEFRYRKLGLLDYLLKKGGSKHV